MPVIQCEHGHYFDQQKYSNCPHCEAGGWEHEGKTVAMQTLAEQNRRALAKEHLRAYVGKDTPKTDKTISIYAVEGRQNPVVGWLVCIKGVERGMDFRLYAGRNYIGRSPSMDICLVNDSQIHRENHCSIVYEPIKKQFLFLPGEGTISYLNGEAVGASSQLAPYDRIEIGSLVFSVVPFCGEAFAWE